MTSFRITATLAGVCALATALAACSGSSTSTPVKSSSGGSGPSGISTGGNTSGKIVDGGNFVLGMPGDPGNLDPQASAASNLNQFSRLAYDQLLNVTDNGTIQSRLAKTWTVNGTRTVLQMNPAITCADGSHFTAADAAANLNYVADPANKSAFLGVYVPVGVKASASGNTVTVTTPKIAPFILQGLAGLPMVCSAGMKNRKVLASKTVGTGPYQLSSAAPNDHYTLTKRTGYTWGPNGASTATKGLPNTITVKIVQNETTAANLLLSGGLNSAVIIGADAPRLAAANLFAVTVSAVAGEMWFNQNKGHATADPQVRAALTKAVDLAQLQKVLTSGRGTGGTTLAATPPAACPGNSVTASVPTFDLAAAKAMLDADGWKVGSGGIRSKNGTQLALRFTYTTTLGASGAAAAELAVKQWGALGVKVTTKPEDQTASVQTLFTTGDWDITWEALNVSSPDQLTGFLSGPTVPKGQNFANIQSTAYNALVSKATNLIGAKGCPDWLAAESLVVKAADVIPFANQGEQFFGKGARFQVSGEIEPTSIRMTS